MVIVKARRPSKISNEISFVPTDDFDFRNIEAPIEEELVLTETGLSSPSNYDFDENDKCDIFQKTIETASCEAEKLKVNAKEAEEKAFNLLIESKHASTLSEKLLKKLGLDMVILEGKSNQEIKEIIERPLSQSAYILDNSPSKSPTTVHGLDQAMKHQTRGSDQGVEINNYSNIAVDERKRKVASTRELLQQLKESEV